MIASISPTLSTVDFPRNNQPGDNLITIEFVLDQQMMVRSRQFPARSVGRAAQNLRSQCPSCTSPLANRLR